MINNSHLNYEISIADLDLEQDKIGSLININLTPIYFLSLIKSKNILDQHIPKIQKQKGKKN